MILKNIEGEKEKKNLYAEIELKGCIQNVEKGIGV